MKLTDFSEQQLRTEKFYNTALPSDYYSWSDAFGWQYQARNLVQTNCRMSPAMLVSNDWQIYKPELRLEKGKFYKDGYGEIWECLKTGIKSRDVQPCLHYSLKNGEVRRTELNGKWATKNLYENMSSTLKDLIEEVPTPKGSE